MLTEDLKPKHSSPLLPLHQSQESECVNPEPPKGTGNSISPCEGPLCSFCFLCCLFMENKCICGVSFLNGDFGLDPERPHLTVQSKKCLKQGAPCNKQRLGWTPSRQFICLPPNSRGETKPAGERSSLVWGGLSPSPFLSCFLEISIKLYFM